MSDPPFVTDKPKQTGEWRDTSRQANSIKGHLVCLPVKGRIGRLSFLAYQRDFLGHKMIVSRLGLLPRQVILQSVRRSHDGDYTWIGKVSDY